MTVPAIKWLDERYEVISRALAKARLNEPLGACCNRAGRECGWSNEDSFHVE